MTKSRHGNKEAKKPKRVPVAAASVLVPAPPLAPAAATTGALAVASLRKKKW